MKGSKSRTGKINFLTKENLKYIPNRIILQLYMNTDVTQHDQV